MSAFMVSKDHIDALVHVALCGPSEREGRWEEPRWAQHDPRVTSWRDQQWQQCVAHGYTGNGSVAAITPDALGEMLWTENERSIESRYPSDHAEMLSVDYCLGYEWTRPAGRPLSCAAAFKALDCYEYQACEHDGWVDSEAKRFVDALRGAIAGVLPGYDAAQWEVDFERSHA